MCSQLLYPQYPLSGRLGWSESHQDGFGEEKHILSLPGSQAKAYQNLYSSYFVDIYTLFSKQCAIYHF